MTRLFERRFRVPFGFRGSPRIVWCLLCTSRRLTVTWCERCLLITESPKTPGHYRYLIWVLDYFWIAVLISDRVVVTCWMIFSDLSIERAVSWKVFGDGDVKDWIAVIWIFLVEIVLFEKIWFFFLRWDFRVSLWRQREGASAVMRCECFCCHYIWFCIRVVDVWIG